MSNCEMVLEPECEIPYVNLFVPGRLCILGEHSDWAAEYGSYINRIPNGYTLVCATNEGIYARCQRSTNDRSFKYYCSDIDETFAAHFDEESLLPIAKDGGFWSYVAGTAATMLHYFPSNLLHVGGIYIDNYLTTLPLKKGLSSSASVCVLTVLALSSLANPPILLTTMQIMALAYAGESLTPSGCGRMDQCVAIGRGAIALMTFPSDGRALKNESALINDGGVTLQTLNAAVELHFVVCDLAGYKDTVHILRDLRGSLHSPFSIARNEDSSMLNSRELLLSYLRDVEEVSSIAVEAIESGNLDILALCMVRAQHSFDQNCTPLCPTQLTSPRLHQLMQEIADSVISESVLAVKGVGSQGDGSAQCLCKNKNAQNEVIEWLKENKGMSAFAVTVPVSRTSRL